MYNATVIKAKFYFLDEKGKKESGPHRVLMNPSSIKYNIKFDRKSEEPTGGASKNKHLGTGLTTIAEEENKEIADKAIDTISMDLIFDVVDEYDLTNDSIAGKTANVIGGIIGLKKLKKTFENTINSDSMFQSSDKFQISVTNEKMCIFNKLIQAAENKKYIAFAWGTILVKGFIKSIGTRFTYFSEFGNPLRAEMSLTIQNSEYIEEDSDVENQAAKDKAADELRMTDEDSIYIEDDFGILN